MKRINVKEIILNKNYYAVCCGDISTIRFKSIIIPEAIVHYLSNDFETHVFLSDIGIEYLNESYVNNLNRVFETFIDANDFISTEKYQEELKQHNDFFDDMYYLD